MSLSKFFEPKGKGEGQDDEETQGLFDITPESHRLPFNIDVVAIHGLGGHWERTWTDKKNGKMWLRDFLPSQLQSDTTTEINPRVMSYGYDSGYIFTKATTGVYDEAKVLLSYLKARREEAEEAKRPLILVAHSLGGLLAKQAMVSAWNTTELYGDIISNIRGIVFLGTPHRGSDIAFWAAPPISLLKALSLGFAGKTTDLKLLVKDSESLGKLSEEWSQRSKSPLMITTFHEQNKFGNLEIVKKDSAFLGLPNEERLTLTGSNHVTMCQFSNATSQRYELVWKAIRRMARKALSALDLNTTSPNLQCFIQGVSVVMEDQITKQQVSIERNAEQLQCFGQIVASLQTQLQSSVSQPITQQLCHKLLESDHAAPTDPSHAYSQTLAPVSNSISQHGGSKELSTISEPNILMAKGLRIHLSQHQAGKCLIGCECSCHKTSRLKSPQMLNAILGKLFVQYTAIPTIPFLSACDFRGCKRQAGQKVNFQYNFPSWLLSKAIHISLANIFGFGIDPLLKIYRLVEHGEALNAVYAGNIALVTDCLARGSATLRDYDEWGRSLLSVAILNGQNQIAAYLVKFQNPTETDVCIGQGRCYGSQCRPFFLHMAWINSSPIDIAWDYVHIPAIRPQDTSIAERMYALFLQYWADYLENQNYTELHLIVLGFNGRDIFESVERLQYLVDDIDARGRTALIWAARKLDAKAVSILLRHGKADPYISDLSGRTALHHICLAMDLPTFKKAEIREIVQLLIVATSARLELKDSWGWSPLHCSFNNLFAAELLLKAGAVVNAVDIKGERPLCTAARFGHISVMALLLSNGAQINAINHDGDTALYSAVQNNAIDNARWLISHNADYTISSDDMSFLHMLANYGSREMIEMLTTCKLKGLDVTTCDEDGETAGDVFNFRFLEGNMSLRPFNGSPETWELFEQSIVEANRTIYDVEESPTGLVRSKSESSQLTQDYEEFHDAQEAI